MKGARVGSIMPYGRKGASLILVFIIMTTLTAVTFAYLYMISIQTKSAGRDLADAQAFWLAEAGRTSARWELTKGAQAAGWGIQDVVLGAGTYTVVTSDNGDGKYTVTSHGYVPNSTDPIARREVIESDIPFSKSQNLSLIATATASSEQASHVAANAKDGIGSTKWKSDVKDGSWIILDFGSLINFDKIVVDGKKINSYTIEHSVDNVTYQGVTNIDEDPVWTFTFDIVSARYLRFNINGDKPEINELQTFNTNDQRLGQGEYGTSW